MRNEMGDCVMFINHIASLKSVFTVCVIFNTQLHIEYFAGIEKHEWVLQMNPRIMSIRDWVLINCFVAQIAWVLLNRDQMTYSERNANELTIEKNKYASAFTCRNKLREFFGSDYRVGSIRISVMPFDWIRWRIVKPKLTRKCWRRKSKCHSHLELK